MEMSLHTGEGGGVAWPAPCPCEYQDWGRGGFLKLVDA